MFLFLSKICFQMLFVLRDSIIFQHCVSVWKHARFLSLVSISVFIFVDRKAKKRFCWHVAVRFLLRLYGCFCLREFRFQIVCKFLSSESTTQVDPNLMMSFVSSGREICLWWKFQICVTFENWENNQHQNQSIPKRRNIQAVYEWQSSIWICVR